MEYENVGSIDQFPPGSLTRVKVDRQEIVVVNLDGELYAVLNYCPHAAAPLNRGFMRGCDIVCPTHSARFDVRTGEATEGPAWDPVPVFDVRVEDGEVLVERRDPWGGLRPPHLRFVGER